MYSIPSILSILNSKVIYLKLQFDLLDIEESVLSTARITTPNNVINFTWTVMSRGGEDNETVALQPYANC